MGQDATLAGQIETLTQPVEETGEFEIFVERVGGRVDADDGVARTQHQPVEDACRNPAHIVGRVVWLQPGRQPSFEPDRVAEAGHNPAFRGDADEVLEPHDLRHGGGGFRGKPGREPGEGGAICGIGEQPVAQLADAHRGNRREGGAIMAVDDQAGDLVRLVRHHRVVDEFAQRQAGKCPLGRHPFGLVGGGDTGEKIAGAARRRLGQQRLHIGKDVPGAADRLRIAHRRVLSPIGLVSPRR
jgi:hypothetical protein